VTRKPAIRAGKSDYYHVTDGEWIEIPKRNHMDQCCDCGLIHRMNFRINIRGRLEVQAFRDARATNGARRHFAEQLAWVYQLFPQLRERRTQPAGTLSGGEQQMCAIGRALMSRPRLLLMDEPSAGLAPLVVQELFELIRRIRAEGLTVLIVEQNIQHVLEVVDRAYLLEVGAIRLAGTSTELKNNEFIRKAYMGL